MPIALSHDLHAFLNVLMPIHMFSRMNTSLGSGDILVRMCGSWEKIMVDQRKSRRILKLALIFNDFLPTSTHAHKYITCSLDSEHPTEHVYVH